MLRKVLISSLPKADFGGSFGSGNIKALFLPMTKTTPNLSVNTTLKETDSENANVEAELGEQVVTDMNGDGLPEKYRVGGNRHYNGGTDLNLPGNSFVFSRDKAMRITDEHILEMFGMGKNKKGYTPADIAKKYNINHFKKILLDDDTDKMQKETAELMIANYNEKLGKLALVQESLKGFPDGIPAIALPYIQTAGFDPASIFETQGMEDVPDADVARYGKNIVPEMYPAKMKFGGPKMYHGGHKKAVMITGLPKAQAGKTIYDEAFLKKLLEMRKNNNASLALPKYLQDAQSLKDASNVPGTQKGKGNNVYGKMDWSSPEMMTDFKERNAWYFKEKPDFNPSKKEDVLDFQKKYNTRAQQMGLGNYLDEDSKFGQYTYSVPNLDVPEGTPAVPAGTGNSEVFKAGPVDVQHLAAANTDPESAPYWLQDIVKSAGAFSDLTRIKKNMPWMAPTNTYLTDPTFYDPTRELAANEEQSNMASQTAAMFSGPQSLNARLSEIEGRALSNAADILGKYNNMNVNVANQFEMNNKQILNTAAMKKAADTTDLYDKTILANQNFDNARMMARTNLRDSLVNAITNRGKTQALNSTFSQYKVDPTTGGLVSFTKGKQLTGSNPQKAIEDKFNELMSNPTLAQHPEIAYKMALQSMGMQDETAMNAAFMRNYNNVVTP